MSVYRSLSDDVFDNFMSGFPWFSGDGLLAGFFWLVGCFWFAVWCVSLVLVLHVAGDCW